MYVTGVENGDLNASGAHLVDLRTDTISQQTPAMRQAMLNAVVGDDGYGEDPTVKELERKAAEMLGKEDALFVVSGTMGNLLSIMVHCNHRGSEVITGDSGHTFRFEQGGTSQIAGAQTCVIKNNDDGTFDLEELKEKIKVDVECHELNTHLIIVENTHNLCGGKVLPLEWLEKVKAIAASNNIPVHMDGARVFNAAIHLKVPVKRVVRDVDTVSFCLSKGLGAPVGSILAGSKSFIAQARRTKKVLGGQWRQAGFLAAAGIVALDTMIDRLQEDHDHAKQIAQAVADLNSKIFTVDVKSVQTNLLLLHLDTAKVNAKDFLDRLCKVKPDDEVKVSITGSCLRASCVRFVLYWQITDEDVQAAISKMTLVIKEFDKEIK